MASNYEFNVNPVTDLLLSLINSNYDISNPEYNVEIYSKISEIIQNNLKFDEDISYLDFDIIKDNDIFKVIGYNAISALWLSGIFPDNIYDVLNKKTFVVNNIKYGFNEDYCELIKLSKK